jgi:hypothetical protein
MRSTTDASNSPPCAAGEASPSLRARAVGLPQAAAMAGRPEIVLDDSPKIRM